MNDLYCKDFEFLHDDEQREYDELKQVVWRRSQLDLQFLSKFINFSAYGARQNIYAKDGTKMDYITFCSVYLGLSETTVKRLYLVYERFARCVDALNGQKTLSWLISDLECMPLTKIFELLPIAFNDVRDAFDRGDISPNMTQKQLREWVKAFKSTKNSNKVDEAIDKDDEEQQATTPDVAERHETYDAIVAYINLFNGMDFAQAKPDELKDIVVANLHCVKNLLVKEFGLKISTTKKRLKVVK